MKQTVTGFLHIQKQKKRNRSRQFSEGDRLGNITVPKQGLSFINKINSEEPDLT